MMFRTVAYSAYSNKSVKSYKTNYTGWEVHPTSGQQSACQIQREEYLGLYFAVLLNRNVKVYYREQKV